MVECRYIETRDKWALFSDGTFIKYVGAEMAQKTTFINGVIGSATSFASLIDNCDYLFAIYFDRAYGSGGANEITQADLDPFGVQLADFTAMITLFENFNKFMNNQAAVQADYDSTINKVRTDK